MSTTPSFPESVIEELFFDHTSPAACHVYQDPEILRLTEKIHKLNRELNTLLTTDEQKHICTRLDELLCDLQVLREAKVFRYAFKLGARTAMEIDSDSR